MPDLESFRRETRAWLEANCPAEMRQPVVSENDVCWGGRHFKFQSEAQRRWLQRMGERGWTVPTWPKAYGGGGLSKEEAAVLTQEMRALGCRPPLAELRHLDARAGAAQVRHRGTEARAPAEDRARRNPLVPGLFRAECRLRSRLARDARPRSTTTTSSSTARRSGPPTPTRPTGSSAWCAPSTAKKHTGISFVLFDMATPGRLDAADPADLGQVAVLRDLLRQRAGAAAQPRGRTERGLDHRQVPAHARARNDRRHRRALERQAAGANSPPSASAWTHRAVCRSLAARRDRALRSRRGRVSPRWMQATGDRARRGEGNPAMSSALKYYGAELNKRRWELMMSAAAAPTPGVGGRTLARRQRGAHLAAQQGQFDRRRHQRNPAQRGGQAHPRPAGRLTESMHMALVSERRTGHAARQRARRSSSERAPVAHLRKLRDSARRRRLRSPAVASVRRAGLQRRAGAGSTRRPRPRRGGGRHHRRSASDTRSRRRHFCPLRCSPPGRSRAPARRRSRRSCCPRIAAAETVIALAVDETQQAPARRDRHARRRATAAASRLDGAQDLRARRPCGRRASSSRRALSGARPDAAPGRCARRRGARSSAR